MARFRRQCSSPLLPLRLHIDCVRFAEGVASRKARWECARVMIGKTEARHVLFWSRLTAFFKSFSAGGKAVGNQMGVSRCESWFACWLNKDGAGSTAALAHVQHLLGFRFGNSWECYGRLGSD